MFEQFGRTFDDNQIKKLGVKTPKPPRGGELTLSFMDFMAGMLAYNKQDFVTQADLNMVYDILADDNENPHLTRQQLYDWRRSVCGADVGRQGPAHGLHGRRLRPAQWLHNQRCGLRGAGLERAREVSVGGRHATRATSSLAVAATAAPPGARLRVSPMLHWLLQLRHRVDQPNGAF